MTTNNLHPGFGMLNNSGGTGTTSTTTPPLSSSLTASPPAAVGEMRPNGGRSRISSFDISLLPSDAIHRRELHAFSVHYSIATSSWIATIVRPKDATSSTAGTNPEDDPSSGNKRRCTSFSFPTEREARKFAKVYSPPKLMTCATRCGCCNVGFAVGGTNHNRCKSFHCKNCGVQICDKCSTRWGVRMLPKTYLNRDAQTALTVRVCKSCDWLSNAFCMALLQGQKENAIRIHESGNINLRCTFADIHKEAMFPIHCAVMGGNLDLVRWLVETQECPISVRRDPKTNILLSIQTSKSRTLIDLAMTGRPKIEILGYLVSKNLSVHDTKDPTLAPKTLQTLMSAGYRFELKNGDDGVGSIDSFSLVEPSDASVTTMEDACVICCERSMDCVLSPCGHQICCSECGRHLSQCPICKQQCSVLKIFKL